MAQGHEVVVAPGDRSEPESKADTRWPGAFQQHVDALDRIVGGDGYRMTLTGSREEDDQFEMKAIT